MTRNKNPRPRPGAARTKPVSRILYHAEARFPSSIRARRCRRALSTYPPGSGVQPSSPGLHGLSVREVYPPHLSPSTAVGSYPTLFTLTPDKPGAVYVSVALSVPRLRGVLPVRKRGALYCPDFPLFCLRKTATERFRPQRYAGHPEPPESARITSLLYPFQVHRLCTVVETEKVHPFRKIADINLRECITLTAAHDLLPRKVENGKGNRAENG